MTILNYFDFWSAVPLDGTATYTQVSQKTRLPADVVYRVLQHGVNLRLFTEVDLGDGKAGIKHNSRSAALAKSPGLRALVSSTLDDAGAPVMLLHESLRRFSQDKEHLTQNMDESAFALLHKTGVYGEQYERCWDFVENDGEGERKGWRQRQFVEFMKYIKGLFHMEDIVLDAHDWASVGAATVVDVSYKTHIKQLLAYKVLTISRSEAQLATMPSSWPRASLSLRLLCRTCPKCSLFLSRACRQS